MSDRYINYNLSQIPHNEVKQLRDIVSEMKAGESIVITVDSNTDFQTDKIFDALILNNFDVSTKANKYNRSFNIIGIKKGKYS